MRTAILLRGTAAAAAAAALCWALALRGLGRIYYLAVFLPAAALAFLLVAWALHLRADGFFGGPSRRRPAAASAPTSSPSAAPLAGQRPPYGLFAPRDSIVARAPVGEEPLPRAEGRRGATGAVLVVAAVELLLLAAALYALAGIGASY